MTIRICKIILLVIIACFFTLAAFNNITDYYTNYVFVEHVMSMDTTFASPSTLWRAIYSPKFHNAFYIIIISWQTITALLCWAASVFLLRARYNALAFTARKGIAAIALTSGFALYAFCFITVGGTWFQMWQSHQWNGQNSAHIFMTMIGFTFLILLSSDE